MRHPGQRPRGRVPDRDRRPLLHRRRGRRTVRLPRRSSPSERRRPASGSRWTCRRSPTTASTGARRPADGQGRDHVRRRVVADGVLPGRRGARVRRDLDGRAHRVPPAHPRRRPRARRHRGGDEAHPPRPGRDLDSPPPPHDAREGARDPGHHLGRAADRCRGRGRRLSEGVRSCRSSHGRAGAPDDGDDRDHAQVLDGGDVLVRGLRLPARGRLVDAQARSGRRPADLARRSERGRDHPRGSPRRRLHAVHVHGRALPGGVRGSAGGGRAARRRAQSEVRPVRVRVREHERLSRTCT